MDAQEASTDGRATLYMDDEIHMFGKGVIKKNSGGVLNIKKTKPSIFFFSCLKRYSNTCTFLHGAQSEHASHVACSLLLLQTTSRNLGTVANIAIRIQVQYVAYIFEPFGTLQTCSYSLTLTEACILH